MVPVAANKTPMIDLPQRPSQKVLLRKRGEARSMQEMDAALEHR